MDARRPGTDDRRHAMPIRRTSVAIAAALVALLGGAFASAPASESAAPSATDAILLDVSPLPVACSMEETEADEVVCLLVRPLGEAGWEVLEAPIDGFEPDGGVGYRLLVRPLEDGAHTLLAQLEAVPLGDVRWRIERIDVGGEQHQPLAHTEPWLLVDASAGRLRADAGCNTIFAAAYPLAPGRIAFGPAASTRMACPEPVMGQEQAMLQALEGAERYEVVGDRLRLSGPGGALWLTPLPPPRPTAAGAVWDEGALGCFDQSVAVAAAAGEVWPSDPLLVTLALFPPWDTAQLDVQRRDVEPEAARFSVVSLEAGGFLDDSVAGYRRVAALERLESGRWRMIATTAAIRCGRGEALWLGPPDLCP